MMLALFTTAKCLMQYSNNRNVFCCNDHNALFHYRPTLLQGYGCWNLMVSLSYYYYAAATGAATAAAGGSGNGMFICVHACY